MWRRSSALCLCVCVCVWQSRVNCSTDPEWSIRAFCFIYSVPISVQWSSADYSLTDLSLVTLEASLIKHRQPCRTERMFHLPISFAVFLQLPRKSQPLANWHQFETLPNTSFSVYLSLVCVAYVCLCVCAFRRQFILFILGTTRSSGAFFALLASPPVCCRPPLQVSPLPVSALSACCANLNFIHGNPNYYYFLLHSSTSMYGNVTRGGAV